MKQEFEMTQAEMDGIIAINKNQMPLMKIGSVTTGMDLPEKINAYWEGLGNKYGFKHMTVEPSAKGSLFFLAEPKPKIVPKTQTENEIDKIIGESLGYLNHHLSESLSKIVEQLEKCNYQAPEGLLINNIAFMALKKLAS